MLNALVNIIESEQKKLWRRKTQTWTSQLRASIVIAYYMKTDVFVVYRQEMRVGVIRKYY